MNEHDILNQCNDRAADVGLKVVCKRINMHQVLKKRYNELYPHPKSRKEYRAVICPYCYSVFEFRKTRNFCMIVHERNLHFVKNVTFTYILL